jgi:hypothetical protein
MLLPGPMVLVRPTMTKVAFFLKETDAEIRALLESRGGKRGTEHRVEYQLCLELFQNLIIPTTSLLGLSFIIYTSYFWIPKFGDRGLELGREDWDDAEEGTTREGFYYSDRALTLLWNMTSTLVLLAISADRVGNPYHDFDNNVSSIATCLALGLFAGVVKVLAFQNQKSRKALFLTSIQFDGALYLFLISFVTILAFGLSIPAYWLNGRLT